MNTQPAVPYMTKVRHYAIAKGMKFFTYEEQLAAIAAYESEQLKKK